MSKVKCHTLSGAKHRTKVHDWTDDGAKYNDKGNGDFTIETRLDFRGTTVATIETAITDDWIVLELFQTREGFYIGHQQRIYGEQVFESFSAAAVCPTIKAVVQFFGQGKEAMKLYKAASIDVRAVLEEVS